MDLQSPLERLVREVDGALAAALMGSDGMPLAQYVEAAPEGVELEAAWVEWGALLSRAAELADGLGGGGLEELAVQCGALTLVMRPLGPSHHLVLALRPLGNVGKGRYLLRMNGPALAAAVAALG